MIMILTMADFGEVLAAVMTQEDLEDFPEEEALPVEEELPEVFKIF